MQHTREPSHLRRHVRRVVRHRSAPSIPPDRCGGAHDTELGTGVFDLRTFLHEVTDVAHTPCFVEQEGPAIELASAKRNWAYVESLEF